MRGMNSDSRRFSWKTFVVAEVLFWILLLVFRDRLGLVDDGALLLGGFVAGIGAVLIVWLLTSFFSNSDKDRD